MRVTTDFTANMKKDLSEDSLNDLLKVAGRFGHPNSLKLLSALRIICKLFRTSVHNMSYL